MVPRAILPARSKTPNAISLGLGHMQRPGERFGADCVEDVIGHPLKTLHEGVAALERSGIHNSTIRLT